jgi:hypothetical protein
MIKCSKNIRKAVIPATRTSYGLIQIFSNSASQAGLTFRSCQLVKPQEALLAMQAARFKRQVSGYTGYNSMG